MRISKREENERMHFDTFAVRYDFNYQYDKPFTKYKINKKSNELVQLIRVTSITKDLNILEIGCGTGAYTKQIAKKLPKSNIFGLDISENIIKLAKNKCKKYKNTRFIVKSAYHTGFKSNTFDAVCGFYVLHHLEVAGVEKEISRILKPGGIVFFYEPNILNPIVYLIKKYQFLKRRVGDSPNEWAINPLKVKKLLKRLEVTKITLAEYIWPIDIISFSILKKADKISSFFASIPLIKYLGGSVIIVARKK